MARTWYLHLFKLRLILDFLFALNVAFAAGYGIFSFSIQKSITSVRPKGSGFLYCFLRGAARISDLLHRPNWNPRYHGVAIPLWWPIAVQVAFVISALCVGVILAVLISPLFSRFPKLLILNVSRDFVALLALPILNLWILGVPDWRLPPTGILLPIPTIELVLFGAFMGLCRWGSIRTWVIGSIIFLHYCYWAPIFQHDEFPMRSAGLWVLMIVNASYAGVWAWDVRKRASVAGRSESRRLSNKWRLASAVISAVVLVRLWAPGRGYVLARAKDPASLTIAMERSQPDYTVTIHGTGAVEYVGYRFVHVRGVERATITQDQVRQLLGGFDRADFFTLEDRAFWFAYHSSRLGVTISVDGKSKQVWSDRNYTWPGDSEQARFVKAAEAIDKIVGTDRWVKCEREDQMCRF